MQGTIQRGGQSLSETVARRTLPSPTLNPAPRDALDLLEQFGTTVTVHHDREILAEGDPE